VRTLVFGVTLLVVAQAPQLKAQTESADVLRQAQELYEQLQIERAVPLLRQVLSPAWTFEVTAAQRVAAYTYLGASLALLGARDSALTYFVDALERDPFTDLDARRFTPAQVALFQRARRLTFAVAARPVTATRVDPRTERATFTVVTTHAASLRVTLRPVDNQTATVLFQDVNDGLREVSWDGLLTGGATAPPGRYELALFGRSELLGRSDSARIFFTVAHERAELEDTLPDLSPRELLPERLEADAGRTDLLKGLAVAAAALVASSAVANGQLGHDGRVLAVVVGGTAGTAGVTGLLAARAGRALPANVVENSQRRAARAAANAAVARRNAARIAATVLVVTPAAGVGP
jgi:tetratricopeptide (TPR) repeat protein